MEVYFSYTHCTHKKRKSSISSPSNPGIKASSIPGLKGVRTLWETKNPSPTCPSYPEKLLSEAWRRRKERGLMLKLFIDITSCVHCLDTISFLTFYKNYSDIPFSDTKMILVSLHLFEYVVSEIICCNISDDLLKFFFIRMLIDVFFPCFNHI